MTSNKKFLDVIKESFLIYLNVGTSRKPDKLKPLHGCIAKDLQTILGPEYSIKSKGIGDDKEGRIAGRYYHKKADITVYHKDVPVAGYGVKFVMRNYSQNSNNYFENMLGETANIRANSIPYFQIFIIFDKVPYYEKGGKFKKYENISKYNIDKYIVLSKDDPKKYIHVPDKTLIILVNLKEKSLNHKFIDDKNYAKYYKKVINDSDLMEYSDKIEDEFDGNIILNNYKDFIEETFNIIKEKE